MELIPSIVQFANILVKSQTPSFFRNQSITFGDGKKKRQASVHPRWSFVSQSCHYF